jgi:hypothetical protein
MSFATLTLLPALGILVGMLVFLELGRWIGARRGPAGEETEDGGAGAVDGAIFALLGLLIAFTFSGAASRFDERRAMVLTEANAIGTAYLRIDLLPEAAQPELRSLFREYLGARLATYRAVPDMVAVRAEYARSLDLQGEIWRRAVAAAKTDPSPAVMSLVVSSLNDTFDIATSRLVATRTHVPPGILALLLGLAFAASLVVGFTTAGAPRRWFRRVLFAGVIAASLFVILDLEYPRLGFIRVDAADLVLEEVLQGMR